MSRSQKTIESETVKTSEVLKKKFGNLSETVKEVNVKGISTKCSLSFDCHDRHAIQLRPSTLTSYVCVNRGWRRSVVQKLERKSRREWRKQPKQLRPQQRVSLRVERCWGRPAPSKRYHRYEVTVLTMEQIYISVYQKLNSICCFLLLSD